MKFSIYYTFALAIVGLSASSVAAEETPDILEAAVDMLTGGEEGVRGTNKTLVPTPGVSRPPPETKPPLTPFPTEVTVTTPPPVPVDIGTPSPVEVPAPVRFIHTLS